VTKRTSALLVLAFLLSVGTAGAQALPSGLRLEGGAGVNGNIVTFNALPNGTGTVTVNSMTFSSGGSLPESGRGLQTPAPYAGIGYAEMLPCHIKLNFETGALFDGPPPMLAAPPLPGLPENLALQYRYSEEHQRSVPVAALAKLTLSLRF
jgi:hypothetical protein